MNDNTLDFLFLVKVTHKTQLFTIVHSRFPYCLGNVVADATLEWTVLAVRCMHIAYRVSTKQVPWLNTATSGIYYVVRDWSIPITVCS